MCGICGVYNYGTHQPADRGRLRRAADAMAHRGPDDEGFYLDGAAGLGNRRLSIIDLPGGHQPLSNEDGTIWVTFNGEIYNHRELRQQLEAGGHRFRTASDTEVIVHLYEQYGLPFLKRLRGMFGFAVWDRSARRLVLARDRLGVKPLYYFSAQGVLAFASELRSLRELIQDPLKVDPQAVYDFFGFRYVPAPGTFYRNVSKLLPGHFLVVEESGIREECYWELPEEDSNPCSAEDYAQQVLECLRESIRLRLMADVPLGVFLSGGVDSTALVAIMAELGVHPLRTFSVGFEEAEYSELTYARRVAKRFRTDHTEVLVRPHDLADQLERLVAFRDEPIAEPTDVALYLMARQAAESVKVVLAGEGSDELFAGYPKYAADRLAGLVSAFPREITQTIVRWLPYRQRRAKLALEALAIPDQAERSVRARPWAAGCTAADTDP